MSVVEALGELVAAGSPSNPENRTSIRQDIGVVVSVDWVAQSCVVNLSDGTSCTARMAGDTPVPGMPVYLLIIGQTPITIGRLPLPALGTVAGAATDGLVDVVADDTRTYRMGFPTSYTPAEGHRVLLNWDAGGHIVNRIDAAPDQQPPEQATPERVQKTRQFKATQSGSFRSAWSSGVVYFGQSYPSAGWFYGTQIADSIPDGASIDSISMYLEVTAASGVGSLPLYLHTSAGIGGGSLALDQGIDVGSAPNGFRGSVTLPNGWGDLLKTGARLGVGTTGPGYRRLNGPAQSAAAGAITITWTE